MRYFWELEVASQMHGVRLTSYAVETLMTAFARQGDQANLMLWFNRLLESPEGKDFGTPTAHSYWIVINYYAWKGLSRPVEKWVAHMDASPLELTEEVCIACMLAYAVRGEVRLMKRWQGKLKRRRSECSDVIQINVMGYGNAGQLSTALKKFETIRKKTLKCFLAIFVALRKNPSPESLSTALEMFNSLQHRYFLTPDVKLYNELIQIAGQARDSDQAINFYNQMKKLQLKPDTITHNSILECLAIRLSA